MVTKGWLQDQSLTYKEKLALFAMRLAGFVK